MALTAQQLATAARRKNRLRELCAAFPEVEADALGKEHVAFKVRKKIFAYYLFVPAYLGPRGWVAIRMDMSDVDWIAIEELARQAYLQIAPKNLATLVG
jgi:hypothetical protein